MVSSFFLYFTPNFSDYVYSGGNLDRMQSGSFWLSYFEYTLIFVFALALTLELNCVNDPNVLRVKGRSRMHGRSL